MPASVGENGRCLPHRGIREGAGISPSEPHRAVVLGKAWEAQRWLWDGNLGWARNRERDTQVGSGWWREGGSGIWSGGCSWEAPGPFAEPPLPGLVGGGAGGQSARSCRACPLCQLLPSPPCLHLRVLVSPPEKREMDMGVSLGGCENPRSPSRWGWWPGCGSSL